MQREEKDTFKTWSVNLNKPGGGGRTGAVGMFFDLWRF